MFYADARDACKDAAHTAPSVVAYTKGKGWVIYNPDSPKENCVPEILFLRQGSHPIPLTDQGWDVWLSILRAGV